MLTVWKCVDDFWLSLIPLNHDSGWPSLMTLINLAWKCMTRCLKDVYGASNWKVAGTECQRWLPR